LQIHFLKEKNYDNSNSSVESAQLVTDNLGSQESVDGIEQEIEMEENEEKQKLA
jgi:hypothetical protein